MGLAIYWGAFLAVGGISIPVICLDYPSQSPGDSLFFDLWGQHDPPLFSQCNLSSGEWGREKLIEVLRKLDHSMIFVLIAGVLYSCLPYSFKRCHRNIP